MERRECKRQRKERILLCFFSAGCLFAKQHIFTEHDMRQALPSALGINSTLHTVPDLKDLRGEEETMRKSINKSVRQLCVTTNVRKDNSIRQLSLLIRD